MKWKDAIFNLFISFFLHHLFIFFNIIDSCIMYSHVQVFFFFFGWMKNVCWNNSIKLKYEIFLKKRKKKKKEKKEETDSSIFYLSNFLASWGNSWGGRIFITVVLTLSIEKEQKSKTILQEDLVGKHKQLICYHIKPKK